MIDPLTGLVVPGKRPRVRVVGGGITRNIIQDGTSFPVNPVDNQLFLNTSTNTLYRYTGGNWTNLGVVGGGGGGSPSLVGANAALTLLGP